MTMALAIAYQIKEQVIFANEPIVVNPQTHFSVEKYAQPLEDWGECMTIV